MGWTKIKAFMTGQTALDLQGNALLATSMRNPGQQTRQDGCGQDNQLFVHGWIAASIDTRAAMTGGLLGSGELLR